MGRNRKGRDGRGGAVEPVMEDRDLAGMEEGIRLFNARGFWHAHEAWEEVWRRKQGECDLFFKGIIQAAAAFHKMEERSVNGARIHLDRSIEKLGSCAPAFLGIDVASLLHDLKRCRARLESGGIESCDFPVLKRSGFGR